jgi:hypothetical protein
MTFAHIEDMAVRDDSSSDKPANSGKVFRKVYERLLSNPIVSDLLKQQKLEQAECKPNSGEILEVRDAAKEPKSQRQKSNN